MAEIRGKVAGGAQVDVEVGQRVGWVAEVLKRARRARWILPRGNGR